MEQFEYCDDYQNMIKSLLKYRDAYVEMKFERLNYKIVESVGGSSFMSLPFHNLHAKKEKKCKDSYLKAEKNTLDSHEELVDNLLKLGPNLTKVVLSIIMDFGSESIEDSYFYGRTLLPEDITRLMDEAYLLDLSNEYEAKEDNPIKSL